MLSWVNAAAQEREFGKTDCKVVINSVLSLIVLIRTCIETKIATTKVRIPAIIGVIDNGLITNSVLRSRFLWPISDSTGTGLE